MKRDEFSFDDRVARRYNHQRAHPAAVSQQIGQSIQTLAGEGASILEIGVGTGRIAWPVLAAGCRVTGIDLSPNMLDEVYEGRALSMPEAPEPDMHEALWLLQADMHALPFIAAHFDAVLAVHVLHLAKDWPLALREATRVLRPGGAFIQGDDWMDPQSVVGQLRDTLRRKVAEMAPHFRPPAAGISRQDYLQNLGATRFEEIIAAEWQTWVSPAERLAAVENRMDAESWILPPELFDDMVQYLREYATATWDDLDERQPVTRRFVLKVYRGDWTGDADGIEQDTSTDTTHPNDTN